MNKTFVTVTTPAGSFRAELSSDSELFTSESLCEFSEYVPDLEGEDPSDPEYVPPFWSTPLYQVLMLYREVSFSIE